MFTVNISRMPFSRDPSPSCLNYAYLLSDRSGRLNVPIRKIELSYRSEPFVPLPAKRQFLECCYYQSFSSLLLRLGFFQTPTGGCMKRVEIGIIF